MNIGIIGGGAIGLLIASYFYQNNQKVTLYTRTKEQANLINQSGIILSVNDFDSEINIEASLLSNKIDQFDLLFVCVKQYSLETILPVINNYKGSHIIFLQNGMSHIEIVKKLSVENCFIGIVEHGALKKSGNEICHTGKGIIKIGQVKGQPKAIDQLLTLHTNDFPILHENDWFYILSQKCLINCTINPLTAIFNIRNGELIANDYFYQISKILFSEVSKVLNLHKEKEWHKFEEICEKTSSNYSSMNRDLFHGRQTEIDSMLGYVQGIAIQKKINVPTIDLVYNMIKGLEKKKG